MFADEEDMAHKIYAAQSLDFRGHVDRQGTNDNLGDLQEH